MPTAEEYDKMSDSEKKKEDWMNSKWRPMMGWLYMIVCFADFVVFPIMWAFVVSVFGVKLPPGAGAQWQPLTLQGAGLFHISMGAVLGLAAWGRTQEKLNGANNGGIQTPATPGIPSTPSIPQAGGFGAPSSFGSPAPTGFAAPASTGFGAPVSSSFGSAGGFGSPAPQATGFTPQVVTGFGGKPAPVQPPDREI